MTKKLGGLKEEIDQMIDNFQVEIVRQFQIQRGSVSNIIEQYTIDEQ